MATKPDVRRREARPKADLDAKRMKALHRESVIEELEKVSHPMTTETRLAAAAMLRADAAPRRAVRVADSEFAHYAVFIWRRLKRYAVDNGRKRWNSEQSQLAARESIRIAESVYKTQQGKLRPAMLLKLVDQPLNKKVQRKGDTTMRIEPRNADLMAHFESLGTLRGFGFDFNVPAATRKALTA